LLGGDGDLEVLIQDFFAKSANDSTVLDLSSGFNSGASSTKSASVKVRLMVSLENRFERCAVEGRTSGLDFELGNHERRRSIIDLLRLREWAGATGFLVTAGAGALSVVPSSFSFASTTTKGCFNVECWRKSVLGFESESESELELELGLDEPDPPLRADSNSEARSKERTSKAGRLGRLLDAKSLRAIVGRELRADEGGGLDTGRADAVAARANTAGDFAAPDMLDTGTGVVRVDFAAEAECGR